MSFVLDNSVALAWCFEDEQTPAVMALLDRVTETGAYAPWLWPLEALNGLLVAERRGRLDGARRARLAGFLRELPVLLDSPSAETTWETVAELGATFPLSMYDACYLELARRRQLPLATLDAALRVAAGKLSVELVGS